MYMELNRFDEHRIVKSSRSPDELQPQPQAALFAAVPPGNGRTGYCWQKAHLAGQRICLPLTWVGHQPEGLAFTSLHARRLHAPTNTAHHQSLFAPVEPEGFAHIKL